MIFISLITEQSDNESSKIYQQEVLHGNKSFSVQTHILTYFTPYRIGRLQLYTLKVREEKGKMAHGNEIIYTALTAFVLKMDPA